MLFNIVEIHKCPVCGKEFGFTEIYSHDHDNIREREVRYRLELCPTCRIAANSAASEAVDPGKNHKS